MQNTNKYDLIKFEDGEFSLDVNVSPTEDTVWLSISSIAALFERDISVIGKHIRNIIKQNELQKNSVWAKIAYTANDGKKYFVDFYNLDMIISVGYRVNSKRGILFRKWATSILKQYMLNGYSLNEKRCLAHSDSIVNLSNDVEIIKDKINTIENTIISLSNPDTLLLDKLFYEGEIFDAYSYIKQLFASAKSSIILIDGYIDLSVLDMLTDIFIPITIYTYPSSTLTNQDIDKFNIKHHLTVIKTNKIHDRFIIIDDTIYLCGTSIKDVGKKRFVLTKLSTITKELLLKEIREE
ncbi:MAG: virulence RhuM family protein [Anaeroplasmataceae bacterium]|nr:virulence RhuM family protein [Anaeroplasmataceae bacterium]